MISPETISLILDTTRIEEVVGEFVTLKKRGVNMLGLCPFHNEKTPSFTVSPAKGIYKCFGCGKGGDAVGFLMEHEHFSYPEALKYLAAKYGIIVEEEKPDPLQQQARDEKENLFSITAFAQKHYQQRLFETEEGKSIGLTYLKERGYGAETIKKFGLGYAGSQWDGLAAEALKNGYKKEYLIQVSLVKAKDGQIYDTFRERIMFPIHNLSGRVLGFGGRILVSDKNKPKYINSAESDIYHKGKVLYGLYFAKSAIVARDNCYLVEGYTDVISLSQAGVENVIATSGTALTTDQIRLIRRYTNHITLLFDGDPAGIKAAFRSIDMILEEGMNVRIVLFPEGEDPDSFARTKRRQELADFIENQADDFISFKTRLLLKETANDPIRRAGLIREIAQTISLIPDPIARSLYNQKCASMMQIEERLMVSEVNRLRKTRFHKKGTDTTITEQADPELPQPGPKEHENGFLNAWHQEMEIIRVMIEYATENLIFKIENKQKREEEISVRVIDFICTEIIEDQLHFEDTVFQKIFDIYRDAWEKGVLPETKNLLAHPDSDIRQRVTDLNISQYTLSKNWESRLRIFVRDEQTNLKDSVVEALYNFKLKKIEILIDSNLKAIQHLETSGPSEDETELMRLLETERRLKKTRNGIAQKLNRIITR